MRFGATLRKSIYEPWRSSYIDYPKLKKLLREDEPEEDAQPWTEDDESRFVEELLNVQLEKVNTFQSDTYRQLRQRTTDCETKLQRLAGAEDDDEPQSKKEASRSEAQKALKELDGITAEITELEKYSRVNFTAFLKAAKKHDRRRGSKYRVRPLLQVRLAALPFNSEDYSPLLYEISTMYSFARQLIHGGSERSKSMSESRTGNDKFESHKFWVHPDNLLEVKTYILRRLPILIYNPQGTKNAESRSADPTITSLYFDNPRFALYNEKVEKPANASSLRIKWFGQLSDRPEINFEKKTMLENGDSEEIRVPVKEKYIQPFINGDYRLEKNIDKLRDREGTEGNGVAALKRSVEEIQSFIKDYELAPILRANYTRTAFQIPGEDQVRISIDTDLAFIREDSLDQERPCREPEQWHRGDIDKLGLKFPFPEVRKGEVTTFPYALLEIKISKSASKKTTAWVQDLMSSHLVRSAPRFSKFTHGVAQLFEDNVNSFPFWLSDMETADIRQDPQDAFREEQERKAKQAADEQAVGSFVGARSVPSFKAAVGSPLAKSPSNFGQRRSDSDVKHIQTEADIDREQETHETTTSGHATNRGLLSDISAFSPFSNSKYAKAHREGPVSLPPGVRNPEKWIKDMNPVRVEPKVWLANQRTFVKWQHVSVLLASLSLGLYNAAGEHNNVARGLAVVYTLIAVSAGGWGWWMFVVRSRMIEARSGRDLDNVVGPIVVCVGLTVALCLNFGFKYHATVAERQGPSRGNETIQIWNSQQLEL